MEKVPDDLNKICCFPRTISFMIHLSIIYFSSVKLIIPPTLFLTLNLILYPGISYGPEAHVLEVSGLKDNGIGARSLRGTKSHGICVITHSSALEPKPFGSLELS